MIEVLIPSTAPDPRHMDCGSRRMVFFDETVDVYVVCYHDGVDRSDHAMRVNAAILPQDSDDVSDHSYSIFETWLDRSHILYKDTERTVWRVGVPITYPRKKFSDPYLHVSAVFESVGGELSDGNDDEEPLADFRPIDLGMVERIDKNEVERVSSPLHGSVSIPVSVSLVIKLRTTKPAGRNNMLLATLNIETMDALSKTIAMKELCETDDIFFTIHDLVIDFKHDEVVPIKAAEYEFPFRFSASDSVNLTYKLNNDFVDRDMPKSKAINIKLVLQVSTYDSATDTYTQISNIITTHWNPFLDFSIIAPPINSSLKTSTNYSHTHTQSGAHRPVPVMSEKPRKSALLNVYKSANSSNPTVNKRLSPFLASSPSSVTVNLTTNTNSTLSGLKLTFIGKLNLKRGQPVEWGIQAVNSSKNKLNLSLIVQNSHTFRSSAIYPFSSAGSETSVVQAEGYFYTRAQLQAAYRGVRPKDTGVVMLGNDIRIGPMEPNTVFDSSISLVGLTTGIFNLDGLKIFDVSSGDGLDFGKLVQVFVN